MNLHYEFWVDYYNKLLIKKDDAKRLSEQLVGHKWERGNQPIPQQEQSLCFCVGYPGLLVGLGYTHEVKDQKGQISNGFSLDFVTGLPYIPGSEVKGILRSAFLQNRDYALEVLNGVSGGTQLTLDQLAELEQICFGTRHPNDHSGALKDGTSCGKDVFLDAWPIETDKNGRLLGLDNITPHRVKEKEDPENDGLTEPTPITLLKVMPDVVFQFRFVLKDTVLSDGTVVSAKQKLDFYQALLSDLGAGAKTNVGFGVLNAVADVRDAGYLVKQTGSQQVVESKAENSRPQNKVPKQGAASVVVSTVTGKEDIKVGMFLKGTVTGHNKNALAFVELLPNVSGAVHISEVAFHRVENIVEELPVGKTVTVKVIESKIPGKIALSVKQALPAK